MNNKKHILFIVENNQFPRDIRVYNEAKFAYEYGFEVSVISPQQVNKKDDKFEVVDGINVYRHPMPFEGSSKVGLLLEYINAIFWEFLLSIKIYIKKPFHIIHGANPPDHLFILALFFKMFGIKYIFDHHDICPENYLSKFNKKDFLYRCILLFERWTFKTADIVISTNESYKKLAIERGDKDSRDVFVVRNGPDLSQIINMPPNNKWKEDFDYLVGYVGTIGTQEDIDKLIHCVDYIVHKNGITNIKFIIVGTGTEWQNMVDLSKKLDLTKYVHFTGFVPYEDFYEIIATTDVCVNPEFRNSFTEKSTMIKIMDYMVFGKPIVQYYTTEGEITAGNAALYVKKNDQTEFAEALLRLLKDPARCEQMAKISKERIDNLLNWDLQKVSLKNAYKYLDYKSSFPASRPKLIHKIYYFIKPIFPRKLQIFLRKLRFNFYLRRYKNLWPVNVKTGNLPIGWNGWPNNKKFALVLTHDVDSEKGLNHCIELMKIERRLGFKSSFYFVPDLYQNSLQLRKELTDNGFEVGIHGLIHDGRLFESKKIFSDRAVRINRYLTEWDAEGFRAPCMHHNLEWISELNIKYDSSTYDFDPFEPQGGGVGSIFPFIVKTNGKESSFVELPYTLPQDFLLFVLKSDKTIDIWKTKLDWIVQRGGMALLITHPDYMNFNKHKKGSEEYPLEYYEEFLLYIKSRYKDQYWHILPKELANYWTKNMDANMIY
jgi:glycosyltransferase involved in cell wall biosynthesis